MASRTPALLVAILLLLLVPGGVAVAQEPVPSDTAEESWPQDEPTSPEDEDQESAPGDDAPPADEQLPPDPDWPVEEEESDEELFPEIPVPTTKTVAGTVAYVRADGKAAIPRGAPKRVRQLIAAANQIVGKPYKWGGGHAKLVDTGYDCSGAVSYALIRTGLLRSPLTSGGLAKWGERKAGRWVSVYAKKSHVYLEVAGLRLDTSAVADPGGRKGVRWRPVIGKRKGFTARHPAGL